MVVCVTCCDDDVVGGCVVVEDGMDEDGEVVDDVVDGGTDEEVEVGVRELVLRTALLLDCDDEVGCDVLRRGGECMSMKQRC